MLWTPKTVIVPSCVFEHSLSLHQAMWTYMDRYIVLPTLLRQLYPGHDHTSQALRTAIMTIAEQQPYCQYCEL